MYRCLSILILIVVLASAGLAQDEGGDASFLKAVPKEVIKSVVSRVLVYSFKPVRKRKSVKLARKIFVAEPGSERSEITIQADWLPSITNVDFRLSDEPFDNEVHFFKEWESKPGSFQIMFGYGDPTCDYSGNTWAFKVAGPKARLWPDGQGGGGCSNHTESVTVGQGDHLPDFDWW